jgi:hypothetical protein
MAIDFSALLNKPTAEIKKPPVLPEGTYYGTLGKYELREIGEKRTPTAEFEITLQSAADDIDLTDEESGEPIDLSAKKLRGNLWLSENAQWQVVDLAAKLGIDTDGQSLGTILPQFVGQSVMVQVTRVPNKDQTAFLNNVQRIAAPE